MKNKKPLTKNQMHEVGIVYKRPVFNSMPSIRKSQDAYRIIRKSIKGYSIDHKEYFWVLLLNNSNKVLAIAEIGRGDTSFVAVNPKEIFQLVLKANATALLLCHNHPSGKLEASEGDKNVTNRIRQIAELFNVKLLDHLIITSESYYSFADNGYL